MRKLLLFMLEVLAILVFTVVIAAGVTVGVMMLLHIESEFMMGLTSLVVMLLVVYCPSQYLRRKFRKLLKEYQN